MPQRPSPSSDAKLWFCVAGGRGMPPLQRHKPEIRVMYILFVLYQSFVSQVRVGLPTCPPPFHDTNPPHGFAAGLCGAGLCQKVDMPAVPHSTHVCCVTHQTCLLCHTADTSVVSHSRQVCCFTQLHPPTNNYFLSGFCEQRIYVYIYVWIYMQEFLASRIRGKYDVWDEFECSSH